MRYEIERKFLVLNEDWKQSVTETRRFRDGLLAVFGGGKVRIRIEEPKSWITVKGPRTGVRRLEFEYEIPLAEAETMLAELCGGNLIEKTRYLVRHDGLTWEVDVHGGALAGLVYAEVELRADDQSFSRPAWLGEEVTGDPRYSKRQLLARIADESGRP